MTFSFLRAISLTLLVLAIPTTTLAATYTKEATYYSDYFDGRRTANGDRFDQTGFSAAICEIPLGQYLYVSKGSTGVVLDANDRPNCSKHPQVIDFSRDVFKLFAPLSSGRISDIKVTPLGVAPTEKTKKFLPLDTFRHLGVILESDIPTVLFRGEGLEIRGRVLTDDTHVLLYATPATGTPVSLLAPVGRDRSFRGFIRLPDTLGDVVFVVAGGNSFDTDNYATLSLIDAKSLSYPSLSTKNLRYTPRITTIEGGSPTISLPKNITAEATISQGEKKYVTQGNALVLDDLPFRIGQAQVNIRGYRTSTPSSLDRSAEYPSLFSGSVFLDRRHDTIGKEKIIIQQRSNFANFRFRTPTDARIRNSYYITKPDGTVIEAKFPQASIDGEYLKMGVTVTGSLRLDTTGSYMLEIVREDGIAHVNIPVTRGVVWSVVEPLTESEITTIRKNKETVISSTLSRINTIRKQASRPSIKLDTNLSRVAQAKVDDMIARNYQGHADPDGRYIDAVAQKLGIDPKGSMGENIGFGTVSDLSLQDGLEESGVHRINMQNPEWTRVGIGYGISGNKVYLVHVFGE